MWRVSPSHSSPGLPDRDVGDKDDDDDDDDDDARGF